MLKMLYDALPHFADVLAAFLGQLITLRMEFKISILQSYLTKSWALQSFRKLRTGYEHRNESADLIKNKNANLTENMLVKLY